MAAINGANRVDTEDGELAACREEPFGVVEAGDTIGIAEFGEKLSVGIAGVGVDERLFIIAAWILAKRTADHSGSATHS